MGVVVVVAEEEEEEEDHDDDDDDKGDRCVIDDDVDADDVSQFTKHIVRRTNTKITLCCTAAKTLLIATIFTILL